MSIPGFSAEVSAYRSSQTYNISASFPQSYNGRILSSALISGGGIGLGGGPRVLSWCQLFCDAGLAVCLTGCLFGDPVPNCDDLCVALHGWCSSQCSSSILA